MFQSPFPFFLQVLSKGIVCIAGSRRQFQTVTQDALSATVLGAISSGVCYHVDPGITSGCIHKPELKHTVPTPTRPSPIHTCVRMRSLNDLQRQMLKPYVGSCGGCHTSPTESNQQLICLGSLQRTIGSSFKATGSPT